MRLRSLAITAATAAAHAAAPVVATAAETPEKAAVVATYADIAHANYEDSLIAARTLLSAVDELVANPSAGSMAGARRAWLASRVPYQQTEVFRFGNPIVDDWEGKVNAWPLDEGLIDYVDADYGGASDENPYAALNIIANPSFTLSGETVDASEITPALLRELHEADEVEANVATGYHAIEFLLWGQDLNGTAPGAGERPWTDYAGGASCTNGDCLRRATYLRAAAELLVSDLEDITAAWDKDGAARAEATSNPDAGVIAMLTGMGSLSYGETAGERMRLGLMLNDPEEEHSCFSDNTHNDHYYDGLGVRNVFHGRYVRIDGAVVEGPSLIGLVTAADPQVARDLSADIDATMIALGAIKTAAEAGYAYDRMLEAGNQTGESLVMGGVDALIAQTRGIERAVKALSITPIEFEGSDSLDSPGAVFK